MHKNIIRIWIIVLLAVLFFTGAASYFSLNQIKDEAAQMLARSVREPLLIQDYRTSIMLLSRNVPSLYQDIVFVDQNGAEQFSLAVSSQNRSFNINLQIPLYQDSAEKRYFGHLVFVYSIAPYFKYIILLWFLELIVFSLIFIREKKRIDYQIKVEISREHLAAKNLLAKKVAHDIRSPLSALGLIVGTMDADKKELINNVIIRINGIAEDLLSSEKIDIARPVDQTPQESPNVSQELQSAVSALLMEKKSLYSDVKFISEIRLDNCTSEVNLNEILRILSNIIDNAVQSLSEQKTVHIRGYVINKFILVEVTDFGSGIPEHILHKIGSEQITTRGDLGNGIGLFYAFKAVKSWGGDIKIESKLGIGTKVTLKIPLVSC